MYDNNIPTMESMLLKLRIKQYINWKSNISFVYLENENYIDQEINKITNHYTILKTIIKNLLKKEKNY